MRASAHTKKKLDSKNMQINFFTYEKVLLGTSIRDQRD